MRPIAALPVPTMASRHGSTNIQDDWQEIDDAGSVHSLSSSEGDLNAASVDSDLIDLGRDRPSSATLSADDAVSISTASSHTIPGETPRPNGPTSPSEPRNAMRATAPDSDGTNQNHNSPLDLEHQNEEVIEYERFARNDLSSDSSSFDPFDPFAPEKEEGDPAICHQRLLLLESFLKEVAQELADRMQALPAFNIPVLHKVKDTIRMLQQELQELLPVVEAYAGHWLNYTKGSATGEIPLNLNMLQWLDNLRMYLVCFQNEMEEETRRVLHHSTPASPTPASPTSAFAVSSDDLEGLRSSMAEFLPIIKMLVL